MKYITIILMVVLVSCHTASSYYDEASQLTDKADYQKAIALLDKALTQRPDYIDALILRGYNKMQLAKFKEAERDYDIILSYDKENTMALFNIGCARGSQKDFKGAIKYYEAALNTKGGQFITMDRIDNSFAPDPKAKYDITTAEIRFNLGQIYFSIDSLQQAYSNFNTAANAGFRPAEALYYIAQIHFVYGHSVQGCAALNQALMKGLKNADQKYLKICGL